MVSIMLIKGKHEVKPLWLNPFWLKPLLFSWLRPVLLNWVGSFTQWSAMTRLVPLQNYVSSVLRRRTEAVAKMPAETNNKDIETIIAAVVAQQLACVQTGIGGAIKPSNKDLERSVIKLNSAVRNLSYCCSRSR